MMRVFLDVRAVIEVPYGTNLSLLTMTLRDSRAVLYEYLDEKYEVNLRVDPTDEFAADQSKD